MTLKIAQSATPRTSTYWNWSVWIEGTDAELDGIQEVNWKLHPTFSPSVYRMSSRANNFKLKSSGWGEFTVYAQVKNKNGLSKTLRHWLTLHDSSQTPATSKAAVTLSKKQPPDAGEAARPSVFLSYSLNNANLAAHLVQALEKNKYKVTRDIDIAAGVEFNRWVKDQISKSDAVVLLGAEEFGSFSNSEIQVAQSAGVPVIPVTLGTSRKALSVKLGKIAPLHVSGGSPADIAPGLALKIGKMLP